MQLEGKKRIEIEEGAETNSFYHLKRLFLINKVGERKLNQAILRQRQKALFNYHKRDYNEIVNLCIHHVVLDNYV